MRNHYLAALLAIVCCTKEIHAQTIGSVTQIQVSGNSLILSSDTNVVIFKVCTDRTLMVNYLPGAHEDPDTLVVANTSWNAAGVTIDTIGNPLRISAATFNVEIDRNPLRFHLYKKNGQMICEEPSIGGINNNSLSLTTTGGPYYGIHNRPQGNLQTQNTNTVSAGNQGGAGGPFVWTTNGWGFLADADGGSFSLYGTTFSFSRPEIPSKRDLEWYFFIGSPKEIFTSMHEVTGFPPLFPKYTLGFMNTEWGMNQTELYSNIRTYREKAIPIDAYILDFDWMEWGGDNYGEFRWGSKFPDGQSGTIVDTLKKYDMHLMGIRKPRVHVATTQGAYCNANAFFIDYVNDYFSGKQVGRLNFNKPAVRKWFWESFAVQNNTYAKGMSGYWNDEADEYGGNLMFMQMQRGQFEGQRSFNNNRVWSINRNFYTGAQRYAYSLWSGDINTGFPTMADQRLFMLSSMTVGVSWWGMDIGGFNGTPNSENYFRWIQFGAFVPVFRVHGTHNQEREPWNYGAEAEAIATEYIRLRYRFMPYIYSAARENHRTGLSIARPLVMEYPDDPKVSNLSTEWLFGSSLLVAPVVTAGAVQQTVYLPEGGWYDFHSGQYFAGSTSYTVPVTRKDIPLFVKAGSIIPMSPVSQSVDAPEAKNTVILSSFPGGDGSCVLYDDDGTTYDYEKGIYSTDTIIHQRDDHRVLITIGSRIGTYAVSPRDWLAEANWIDALPDSVVLDGKLLKNITLDSLHTFGTQGWSLDSLAKKCYAKFTDNGDAHTVVFYFSHGTSSILQENQAPHQFELEQNYPNPFNPTTTIGFTVVTTVSSEVFESAVKKENDGTRTTLKVYNVLGQEVSILFNGIAETGKYHQVTFDASNLSSGMYVARLQSGDNVQMRKMTLLK